MIATTNPDTLDAREVARRFDVTPRTLLKYAAAGTLPFKAIYFGKAVRFARLDVEAALGALRLAGEPVGDARGPAVQRAGKLVSVRA